MEDWLMQQTLSWRSQQKAVSSVTKLHSMGAPLPPLSPDPTAGVCFTFSANDSIWTSHLAASPPLSRGKNKEEEKETDKSGLCHLAGVPPEASTAPFPVKAPETPGRVIHTPQNPGEAYRTERVLCQLGV